MKNTSTNGNVFEQFPMIDFTNTVIKAIEDNDAETFSKELVLYLLNEIKKNEIYKIELYAKEFIQHK